MPRTEIVGTGITQRSRTMYDVTGSTSGDIEAARDHFRLWANEWNSLIREGGTFGAVTVGAREVCENIIEQADVVNRSADSPEDFAFCVLTLLNIAKAEIGCDNADGAARFGFEAGVKWATALMKWQWERPAIRGDNTVKSASTGGIERAKMYQARNDRIKARYQERLEALGNESAAKESVQREFSIERYTLNRILRAE